MLLILTYWLWLFSSFFYDSSAQVTVDQFYPVGIDGQNPLISAVENTGNVSMFCVARDSGVVFETTWAVKKDSEAVFTALQFNDGIGVPGTASENFMSTPNVDRRQNLTILTFDATLDNGQIGCGLGNVLPRMFDLRIIRLPTLLPPDTQEVAESSAFSLSIESSSGFPLLPDSYQWSMDSVIIPEDSVNPNISVYPNITFNNVNRNDSGNYSITVTNEAGTTNGYFILDVQYGPEGVAGDSGPFYVLVDSNVTLTGFTSITGNPIPNSQWVRSGETPVTSSTIGQLSLSSVQLSDTGSYTNTLSNTVAGQPMDITNTVELIIAEGPSIPLNVMVLNIGAEYVNISWSNPTNLGTPVPLTQYRVMVESSVNNVTVNVSGPISSDYTLVINGLEPSTLYTVTIRGVSMVEQIGNLISDSSIPVMFNTTLGAPRIESAIVTNTNGNLSVSWDLVHTGGGSLTSVTVLCSSTMDDDTILVASTAPLATIIDCTSEECSITGTVSIGPVTAGMNYSCIVTVENNIPMEDEMRTNYILSNTGIPSSAVIISAVGGAGSASITLRVDNYGVTDPSQFSFIISANGGVIMRMISPDSIDNPVVTIMVDDLPVGQLVFTVSTSNIYGTLMVNTTSDPVTITPITSTATPSTSLSIGPSTTSARIVSGTVSAAPGTLSGTPITATVSPTEIPTGVTTQSTSTGGLSGGAIAGIIIAIIILLAIIALVVFIVVYLVYQSRGDSYKVEGGGGKGGVVVEEHDIDIGTELQSTKPPTSEPPPQNPSLAEKPKQELHYADLADFAPNKRNQHQSSVPAPSAAKPMPIEEVQYAVIRPQDQQKQVPDPAAGLADENV